MIELEEAVKTLEREISPQEKTHAMPLSQITGRHVARDLYAPIDVPGFNRSAMDGYAVLASRTRGASRENPVVFDVLTQINAGDFENIRTDGRHAARIMTGAAIPDCFDTVVKQEDTDCGAACVKIYTCAKPYDNYSKTGEDIPKGELVVKKATRLGAIHAGILASLGIGKVEVLKPLKAGLLNFGNELVETGGVLQPGQIYDSNRYMIGARLEELGVEVVASGRIKDDEKEACAAVDKVIDNVDILITTGGVSVGDKDILPQTMEEIGARRLFWRLNMRPGTPALASLYRGKIVLSLSGNPFAAFCTFELLFRPALSRFLHTDFYSCKRERAALTGGFAKASRQRRFLRAFCREGFVSLLGEKHESSILSSMQGCNCFIDIKAGTSAVQAGERVEVVLL